MKQLILNADDFGLTRGVNEGIVRAHRGGVLTSTTLMANGAAFEDAVERARENPGLGVGCHLVLTGGKSVAPKEKVSSLVDGDGRLPESLGLFVARLSAGRVRIEEIELELRAQIEKVRAAGIEPSHLDTHKHTHAHPRVMEAVGKVAQQCGISRVRKPVENLRDSWRTSQGNGDRDAAQLAAAAAVRAVEPAFAAIGRRFTLHWPDNFLGLAMTGRLRPAALRRMIENLPEGSTEIMLHPGVCDEELMKCVTRLKEQRETELAALMDAGVKSAVAEQGIRLISYRELN
jgi:hopanoid biosynthesis associated protein HpnK